MPLRFIPYTRVSMQRMGLLAAACAAVDDRRPNSLEGAAAALRIMVEREVSIPAELRAQAETYLNGLRMWKRYRDLRGRPLTPEDSLEVQDLWLADPGLPAATGALRTENTHEMPLLGVSLRLLRDGSFTRTDRGRALLLALGDDRMTALQEGTTDANPLRLPPGAQLLVLYALLEADGDFLQSLWRTASGLESMTFSRAAFTTDLKRACEDLRVRARGRARTGADHRLLLRLAEWEKAVSKPRGSGSEWGGGRPPDQMATIRLEPFVDCGILDRRRFLYEYSLRPGQQRFLRALAEAEDVYDFAQRQLVSGWLEATETKAGRADTATVWRAVQAAYGELRSRLGFASFIEVLLVANGRLLQEEPAQWFELHDGIELLHARRRESPKDVRLGISQAGDVTYMKLSDSARTT